MVAVLALSIGCTDDDGGSEATSVEDEPDVTVVAPVEPGAAIAEGFTVVEGSVPIGPALPAGLVGSLGAEDLIDEGWTAQLLVTGDLVAVVEAYLAQGVAAGLVQRQPVEGDPIPCPGDDQASGVEVVTCWATASASGSGNVPNLTITGRQGTAAGAPVSHVELRWSELGDRFQETAFYGSDDADPPGPPEAWPALAEVGDVIGVDLEVPKDLRVEEGSRLAGPVLVGGEYLGQRAVLEVTGDPTEVLARYRAQMLETWGPDNVFDHESSVGDATITSVAADEAGGDKVDLRLVERPGETAWLTLSTGHD